jgi:hypothetical protein
MYNDRHVRGNANPQQTALCPRVSSSFQPEVPRISDHDRFASCVAFNGLHGKVAQMLPSPRRLQWCWPLTGAPLRNPMPPSMACRPLMEAASSLSLKGAAVGCSEHRADLCLPKSGCLCLPCLSITMMTGRWPFKKTRDPGASSSTEKKKLSLMHVKCIHDLCSLLDHILIYLIVSSGPIYFFH